MRNETASREIESLDYYLQNHTNDYSEESHMAMMMAIKALRYQPILLKEHDAEPRTMRAIMDRETGEIYVYRYTKRMVDMIGITIEEVNTDES